MEMTKEQRNELVMSVEGLVKSIAGKLGDKKLYEDLVQEGYVGAVEAAQKFDADLSQKFAVYAFPYIRGKMLDLLYQRNSVNLGKGTACLRAKIRSLLDCGVTYAEIARLLNISEKRAKMLSNIQYGVLSIDTPIPGTDLTIGDSIADSSDVAGEVCDADLSDCVRDRLPALLNKTEYDIITKVYGLGCAPVSQSDIALEKGVSRQYISKVMQSAVEKIKKDPRMKALFESLS